MQALDVPSLWRWLGEAIENQVPQDKQALFAETVKANIEFPRDAAKWAKIFFHEKVPIDEERVHVLYEAGEQFFVEAEQAVDKYGIDLSNVLIEMKKCLGLSGKKLFMPLRIALTGETSGPELAHIAALLGQKKMKYRLGQAFQLVSAYKNRTGTTDHATDL